jgi:poly(A) polymerase
MLRAVKYASLAEFKLPFFLREKIKKAAPLLKLTSPSRLTEELSKILKSPMAGKIIAELNSTGLYQYLQPKATHLIALSPDFKNKYFKTLEGLNKDEGDKKKEYSNTINEGLGALVRDYLEDNVVWETMNEESYKDVFTLARKFVLPMNPPRIELGRAVRHIFAEHNIIVRKWRRFNRV